MLESRTDLTYIDMDKFRQKLACEISSELMRDRIARLSISIGGKWVSLHRIFAASNDRIRIANSVLTPNVAPGAVVNMRNGYPIPDDYDGPLDQTVQVFTTR